MGILKWFFNHLMLIAALFFFVRVEFFSIELAEVLINWAMFLFFVLAAFMEMLNNKLDKLTERFKDGTD